MRHNDDGDEHLEDYDDDGGNEVMVDFGER